MNETPETPMDERETTDGPASASSGGLCGRDLPEPFFEAEGVTLYQGDCISILDALPTASVDAVVTDPPYCSGGSLEAQKNVKAQGLRGATVAAEDFKWFQNDNMSTGGLVFLLRSMMVQAARLLKDGGTAYVFTDWRMVPILAPALESSGLRYRNMIIWDKGNAGLGGGFRPAHEVILEYAKGTPTYYANDGSNVLRVSRVHASRKHHNTEKPVELIAELIRVSTPEGGLVLDPFAGSGSVAVAAKGAGRRAVAVELSDGYCAVAAQRLSQTDLFSAA